MKTSRYDDETFFEKYGQMDRSRLGLAGAGEWETLEPLLPDFAGKRVLDLGCGYGWHCIYAAEHGAASVTGVDLSEKMLAVAREKTRLPQVTYVRGDMAEIDFPPERFDVVLRTGITAPTGRPSTSRWTGILRRASAPPASWERTW